MNLVIETIYSLLMVGIGIIIVNKRYTTAEGWIKEINVKEMLINHRLYLVFSVSYFVTIEIAFVVEKCLVNTIALEAGIRWLSLLWGCLLISYIDYKEHIIPNKILLGLIVIRVLLLVIEILQNMEFIKQILVFPALGAVIGAFVMLVGKLISRNGVGMGDIKYLFVVGMYVSSQSIISVLMYTFMGTAVFGIIMLLTKKMGMKDSLPLAPFVLVGVLFKFMIMMCGGIN